MGSSAFDPTQVAPIPLQCGRATLTSGTPVTVSDVTAATSVYWTPYNGIYFTLYDGSKFIQATFSETQFKLTDSSQTGGTITGTTITGLTDTSKLFVGMKLSNSTGTGTLAANTTIASIVSATSITVNNAASVNGTLTNLTFKMPASSIIDVFAVSRSGVFTLVPGTLWSSAGAGTSTRADTVALVSGRYMNTSVVRSGASNTIAANQGTLLFTVMTTSTDGQTEDSGAPADASGTAGRRLLGNVFNRILKPITRYDNTTSWTNAGNGTWSAMNGGVACWKHEFVRAVPEDPVEAFLSCYCNSISSSSTGAWAIAINSASSYSALKSSIGDFTFANGGAFLAMFCDTPSFVGYGYTQGIQTTTNSGTVTFFGTQAGVGGPGGGNVGINSGMLTRVWC